MDKAGEFYIYRRHLPHFRRKGHLYFVTWRLRSTQKDLDGEERDIVVSALRHFDAQRYQLWAYVVMNDHVHVVVLPEDDRKLEEIVHSWKSYTAHRLTRVHDREGPVWQHESFDRIVRNEPELYQKMVYVLNNPRKRWPEIASYPWVWCKGMEQ